MLLLHVSDTHLGADKPRRHGRVRERELDFYDVFDEVIDIAIKEGVDAVIHCGDFFNKAEPSPQTYYYAFKSLRRLRDSGIPFLVIAGQHDQPKTATLSPLKLFDEVGLARTLAIANASTSVIKLRSGELGVTAIPYTHPQLINDVVKMLRKPESGKRILMAHLLLKELGIPNAHISLSELGVMDYAYVALGDYHLRYEVNYGGTPVVYPGSTEALDVLEASDERYVVLVDLSGSEARVNWIKLNSFRRWVVLNDVRSYSQLIKSLDNIWYSMPGKPPMLHIRVSKDLPSGDSKLINDYLDSLVRSNKILFYRIEVPGVIEEESSGTYEEVSYVPTLELVVHNVVGDKDLAEVLLGIIKGCDDVGFVNLMINRLVSDVSLLSRLERLIKK